MSATAKPRSYHLNDAIKGEAATRPRGSLVPVPQRLGRSYSVPSAKEAAVTSAAMTRRRAPTQSPNRVEGVPETFMTSTQTSTSVYS